MAADDWVKTTPISGGGYALDFDGSDDYVDVSGLDSSYTNITQALWVKTSQSSSGPPHSVTLMTKRQIDGSGWPGLAFNNSNALFMMDKKDYINYVTGPDINDGAWHQVTGVKSGNNYTIYVDGVSGNSKTDATALASSYNLHIGHHGAWGKYFSGSLDDVRIYNRALSAKEVEALAGSGSYTMGSALTVKDDLKISSAKFDPSASGHTLWLKGDFENYGGFNTSATGHVILNGLGTQTMTGSNNFYNLSATGTNTIVMAHNGNQNISGSLVLQNITLRSTKAGSGARMTLDGSSGIQTVDTVDVADNDASGGQEISCTDGCTDSGGTTNWSFGAAAAAPSGDLRQLFQFFMKLPERLLSILFS